MIYGSVLQERNFGIGKFLKKSFWQTFRPRNILRRAGYGLVGGIIGGPIGYYAGRFIANKKAWDEETERYGHSFDDDNTDREFSEMSWESSSESSGAWVNGKKVHSAEASREVLEKNGRKVLDRTEKRRGVREALRVARKSVADNYSGTILGRDYRNLEKDRAVFRSMFSEAREPVDPKTAAEGRRTGVVQRKPGGPWGIISYKGRRPVWWNADYETRSKAEAALRGYQAGKH